MVVRKNEVQNASWRLTSPLFQVANDKPISAAKLNGVLKKLKANRDLGPTAVAALKAAYKAARTAAKADPTRDQIRAQISKAIGSLINERAKGRVNDGYVDKREAAQVKGDVAKELYTFVDTSPLFNRRPTPEKDLKVKATHAQISQAFNALTPIVDAGFRIYRDEGDPDFEGPGSALRKAAAQASLSPKGRATLMTALNGASSRSDGAGWPNADAVKTLLRNAMGKLFDADGATIVDLDNPNKAPARRKDAVTTGLEVDRTPAATGMTLRAMLEFASTL